MPSRTGSCNFLNCNITRFTCTGIHDCSGYGTTWYITIPSHDFFKLSLSQLWSRGGRSSSWRRLVVSANKEKDIHIVTIVTTTMNHFKNIQHVFLGWKLQSTKIKKYQDIKSFKLVFLKSWFIQQPASLLNNYTSFLNTQCLLNLYIKKIILDLLFKGIWLCKSVAAYLSYKVGLTLFSTRSAEFKHTSLIAYNSWKLLISAFAISTNQKNHLHRLFLGFVGARHI